MGLLARFAAIVALLAIAGFSTTSMADDWVATKLRGNVLQLVDGEWVKLKRGDVVPDDRVIRTMRSGNVQFKRAAETIDLGPETQIQIFDKAGKRFTTVKQYFGTVAVEAEVQNVQHFAVQTPHMAAVVKGTKFVVSSGKDGAVVKVTRGHVAVEDQDTHQTTLLSVGQTATTEDGGAPLKVSGKGDLPVIYAANGKPVAIETDDLDTVLSPKEAAAEARAAALAGGATAKEAEKAAKEAAKDAEHAAKDAEHAANDAAKDAEHAVKEAEKAAEKEAKAEEKSSGSSGGSGSGSSGSSGGDSGSGDSDSGDSDSGKGKKGKD